MPLVQTPPNSPMSDRMTPTDPVWLDRMYNNRARVPESAEHLARWTRDSADARATTPGICDLRYGHTPSETLDVFAGPTANAPVLFFIHGGWWRSLDKSDHSFVAPPFVARGACVVLPNYALCPGTEAAPVTIPDIALQMVRALAWTWRHVAEHGGDPSRITVAGHSAGGHLAAMLLACDWQAVAPDLPVDLVRNALSISGVHDLREIRHVPFLADSLRLTEQDAQRASPALWPAPKRGTLYSVAGADESEAFHAQNAAIREAWGAKTVPVCELLPGLNHFSIVEALADPAHALHQRAVALLDA